CLTTEKGERTHRATRLNKDFNDQTDALAKAGAQDGDLWSPPPQTTTPAVVAITRSRRRATSTEPASQAGSLTPQIANG
ncbi:hypothetical protein QQF64_009062, partial [Cirrhinus molitorella]